ncbi:helix-turn-helix domain-containing protein [Rossellomorea aquimaris]|uniref:helix-turn-helix domain-containing protein n=1 Tax=Rossellomorea aquimaris TaxID=189382 RepID=UPI00165391D3|nr:helix-turn-helix transcriptional regulator [Rossellomorea aquimaris]
MNGMFIKLLRHFTEQLTQEALAEKVGISQSTLSKYEAGILKVSPDAERIIRKAFTEMGLDESDQIFLYKVMNNHNQKGDK